MKNYAGTKMITVTCTSPRGVRKIRYCYHYTPVSHESVSRAHASSRARARSYTKQGWRVVTTLAQP